MALAACPGGIAETLVWAAVYSLASLAVGLAFCSGPFNCDAEGRAFAVVRSNAPENSRTPCP